MSFCVWPLPSPAPLSPCWTVSSWSVSPPPVLAEMIQLWPVLTWPASAPEHTNQSNITFNTLIRSCFHVQTKPVMWIQRGFLTFSSCLCCSASCVSILAMTSLSRDLSSAISRCCWLKRSCRTESEWQIQIRWSVLHRSGDACSYVCTSELFVSLSGSDLQPLRRVFMWTLHPRREIAQPAGELLHLLDDHRQRPAHTHTHTPWDPAQTRHQRDVSSVTCRTWSETWRWSPHQSPHPSVSSDAGSVLHDLSSSPGWTSCDKLMNGLFYTQVGWLFFFL